MAHQCCSGHPWPAVFRRYAIAAASMPRCDPGAENLAAQSALLAVLDPPPCGRHPVAGLVFSSASMLHILSSTSLPTPRRHRASGGPSGGPILKIGVHLVLPHHW